MPLLVWLVLPLLAAVVLVTDRERGRATARLIVPVFALATLDAASGTLDLSSLADWALATPSNGLFLSISLGLAIGGIGPWPPAAWRRWVAGLPLVLVLLANGVEAIHWPALLLGAVLGALPLLASGALPPRPLQPETRAGEAISQRGWAVVCTTVVLALLEPLLLTLVVPLVPLVWSRAPAHTLGLAPRQRVLPVLAVVLAVCIGWFAITIGGTPWLTLGGFAETAPLSPAAERLLGLAAVLLVLALLAPWPLHRLGVGIALAPAAVILAHRFATSLAPGGIVEWRTLAAMVLVPAAVGAAVRRYWSAALLSVAALMAMRFGWWPVAAALAAGIAALLPAGTRTVLNPLLGHRVSFPTARGIALLAAVGLAAAAPMLLADEVVLATLLGFGLATAAARSTVRASAE